MNLGTLEHRRWKFDMIQVFKILRKIDDLNFDEFFTYASYGRTRGHSLKLVVPKCRSNYRQSSFSVRVINCWNSLPESTVSATSIDVFKKKLDIFDFSPFLKYRVD